MLTDEEKRELLELARSEEIRLEFRALKRASGYGVSMPDLDRFLEFLTVINRFLPLAPRPPKEYESPLL